MEGFQSCMDLTMVLLTEVLICKILQPPVPQSLQKWVTVCRLTMGTDVINPNNNTTLHSN